MENKYYTPTLDDIRLGYEYEINYSGYWKKLVITDFYTDGYGLGDVQEVVAKINNNPNQIRIPYLTKEQIIAEGWELTNVLEEDDEGKDIFSTGFEKYINDDNWYSLVLKDNKIIIYKSWYRNNVCRLTRTVYYGKCPSINEFRTITKLLNI